MLAKNLKLADQLSSEANFMIGGLIGSPSFGTTLAKTNNLRRRNWPFIIGQLLLCRCR
jgi:hypothetical protein